MATGAQVIPIRHEPEPNCGDCINALFGRGGVYCRVFHEDIYDEKKVAAECPMFESDSAVAQ